jgi:hypothetical protein
MIDGIPALPIIAFATVPYIALQPSRQEKE